MPLPIQRIDWKLFGGGNWYDPPEALTLRSHQQVEGGYRQIAPVESPDLLNADFYPAGIGKRLGSEADDDLTSVLVGSESLIAGVEFNGVEIIVGKKSIYTNQSGSWAQINDSASSAYTHSSDVSKVSFAVLDGHLFIGTDATRVQVYVTGADLDPELNDSNTYEANFGSNETIAGWSDTGYYILFTMHNRLCASKGTGFIEYTDADEPWDLTGGGQWLLPSDLVAATTFVNRGGDASNEVGFFFCKSGLQIVPGFNFSDAVQNIEVTGTGVPINYRSVVKIENWLVYLTRDAGLQAANLTGFIDLGRRLKAQDSVSGPLDTFSPTNSDHGTKTYGYYDAGRKKAIWYYPDGASNTTNTDAIVLDLNYGEPAPGESQLDYERRLRLSHWSIFDSSNNPWFVHTYKIAGGHRAVLASGKTYTPFSGKNDLGSVSIQWRWDLPDFDSGLPTHNKMFGRLTLQSLSKGNWNVDWKYSLNRDGVFANGESFLQVAEGAALYDDAEYDEAVYAGDDVVENHTDADLVARFLRHRFQNFSAGQDPVITSVEQEYRVARRPG